MLFGTIKLFKFGCRNQWHRIIVKNDWIKKLSTTAPLRMEPMFQPNPGVEKMLRRRDNIPDNFQLIYRHREWLNYMGIICTANVAIVFSVVGYIYMILYGIPKEMEILDVPIENTSLLFNVCGLLMILTVSLIRHFLCRTALRIYWDRRTNAYKIICPSNIPFTRNCTEFVHDRKSLVAKSVFNYYDILCKINVNGKSFYLFEDEFRCMGDYHNLVDGEKHIYK